MYAPWVTHPIGFTAVFCLKKFLIYVFEFVFRSQYCSLRQRQKRGMTSKAQTALRLEVQMLKRAELLVPHLAKDPLMRAIGQVSRSSVLRVALAKGLMALESEHGGPSLAVPSTTASLQDGDAVVVFSDDWSELRRPRKRTVSPPTPPTPSPPAWAETERVRPETLAPPRVPGPFT